MRSAVPPSKGLAIACPGEADDGPVVVLRTPVLHRDERRLLVAELLDDPVHLRVVDRVDLRREREGAVVAQADLGSNRDRGRVAEWLPLLRLDDVDRGAADREQLRVLENRRAIRALHELLDGLVEHRTGAQLALDHRTRRLARPKARNPGALAQLAGRVRDGSSEIGRGKLDLEDDGALRGGSRGDVHGRPSIRAASRARPGRSGGRGGGRTLTSLA